MGTFKKRARGTVEHWTGGTVRWDARGTPTYWITRRLGGKRWNFSLRCHELESALAHLRRWEADPWGYQPAEDARALQAAPLALTEALCEQFADWSERVKHNGPRWVREQRAILTWWRERLGEVDLRRLALKRVLDVLEAHPEARQHRVAVIKALYAWLRKVRHVLPPEQDPTLGTLSAPQARPEQWTRRKAFTVAQFEAVRRHLSGVYADAADVQAGTGWHVSETCRFAESGAVEERQRVAILACPQTKSGTPLLTEVSEEVAEAARRLREHGHLSPFAYWRACRDACDAAGLEPGTVAPGSFRHSVATWAVERGASPESVSAFLNHKSVQTTKRFYSTLAVPRKIPTLR